MNFSGLFLGSLLSGSLLGFFDLSTAMGVAIATHGSTIVSVMLCIQETVHLSVEDIDMQ